MSDSPIIHVITPLNQYSFIHFRNSDSFFNLFIHKYFINKFHKFNVLLSYVVFIVLISQWDAERLKSDTMFVMGAKANK